MARHVICHVGDDVSEDSYSLHFQIRKVSLQKKSHGLSGKALHIHKVSFSKVFYPEDGRGGVIA
jgi:hypothetical protein